MTEISSLGCVVAVKQRLLFFVNFVCCFSVISEYRQFEWLINGQKLLPVIDNDHTLLTVLLTPFPARRCASASASLSRDWLQVKCGSFSYPKIRERRRYTVKASKSK